MTNACPECGTPVSERAAVCPQCGFPLRRDFIPVSGAAGPPGYGAPGYGAPGGYPGGPPPKKSNSAVILVAIIGGGFALVMLIGVLAALAIPRFTQASARAKQRDGTGMLQEAYIAEQRYFMDHGEFTSSVEELKGSGWREPVSASYTLRIASATKHRLCLEVDPKAGATDVYAMSMDGAGKQYYVAECGYTAEGAEPDSGAVDRPIDLSADRDTAGRRLMGEVYAGIVAYRAEHGHDPAEAAPVLARVHQSPASRIYALHVSNGRHGFCMVAEPQEYPDDVHSWAVDSKGLLFDIAACNGEPVDSLGRAPAPEP